MVVRHDSPVEELMRIGHSSTSETFLPQVEDAGRCLGDGFAFVDCPGFLDNRGFEINVANAVNVRHAVATASSAVVVVVVNYYSLRADRGKGLHDLLSILLGLFGSVERIKAHAPSVMLAIAHAPVTHPETGAAMTLERYQRSLLDPSGLDETTGEVLRALLDREGSAFLFHLLGRGDDSWLTREDILARVRSLPPIREPASLFESVLSSADKEQLRALVATLGGEVRQLLVLGTPEAYAAAATLVMELQQLRLVEHRFLEALVEAEVRVAIEERAGSLMALVDGLFLECKLDGKSEGETEAGDVCRRLEEAHSAIENLRAMRDAFSSIEMVRELLLQKLSEATAKLENAGRRRAEANGRMAMAGALQEALRTVGSHRLGDAYNIVREVLALPGAMAAAQEEQRQKQQALKLAHAAELRALSDAPSSLLEATHERHKSALRELAIESAAADAAWTAHLQAAAARLRARDGELMATEGAALYAKAGTSLEQLCAEPSLVDLSRKRLTPHDIDLAMTSFRVLPPLLRVRTLILSGNDFGDAAVGALADGCSHGALQEAERLFLDSDAITDDGLAELSRAIARGVLPQLDFLDLTRNQIGDRGIAALATALRTGGLANLRTLYLYNNRIGSDGLAELAAALCSLESPPLLEKLYLDNNQIREAGVEALRAAIESGCLPSLTSLHLSGNPVPAAVVESAVQSVQRQAEARGAAPRLRPTPQTRDIEAPPVE